MDAARAGTLRWVAAALVAVALPACKPERPRADPESAATPATAAHKPSAGRDTVVARIGDRDVTLGELDDRLDELPVYVRMRYQSVERRLEFLDQWVQFQALVLSAAAAGYGADPEVLDAAKDDLVERWLRDQVDDRVRTSDVPDEAVAAWYRDHPTEFRHGAQVRVSDLRVKDGDLATRILARAKKVMADAAVDKADVFRDLVAKDSDDEAVRRRGGDLGLFPRLPGTDAPAVPKAVEEAASRLTEAFQFEGPVAAGDGWHLLMATGTAPAVDEALEEARPRIVARLMDAERERRRTALVREAVRGAAVTVDDDAVRRVAAATRGTSR